MAAASARRPYQFRGRFVVHAQFADARDLNREFGRFFQVKSKRLLNDPADTQFVKQLVAACGEVGAVPRGIALPLGECGRHAFRGHPRELHATAAPQRRQQPDRGPVATPQRAIVLLPSFLHFHRDLEEVVTRLLA